MDYPEREIEQWLSRSDRMDWLENEVIGCSDAELAEMLADAEKEVNWWNIPASMHDDDSRRGLADAKDALDTIRHYAKQRTNHGG